MITGAQGGKEDSMKKIASLVAATAMVVVCFGSGTAMAQEEEEWTKDNWPMAVNTRPLTLAKSMLEIRGDTLRLNLSKDAVGKPISLAPDIYFGVNDKLSVGVTHGTGICLTGADNGCAKAYNDVGIDALYALMGKGNLQVAGHGGLQMASLSDPFLMGINLGLLVRIRSGKIALVADPRINIGVTERDAGNKESLIIPAWLRFQASTQANLFVRSGAQGPLDGFGDAVGIPLGVGADYTLNNRLDFGFEFAFSDIKDSADGRWLVARAALRL